LFFFGQGQDRQPRLALNSCFDPPASAFQVQGLQKCTAMSGLVVVLYTGSQGAELSPGNILSYQRDQEYTWHLVFGPQDLDLLQSVGRMDLYNQDCPGLKNLLISGWIKPAINDHCFRIQ
jgi:hypothetical protein